VLSLGPLFGVPGEDVRAFTRSGLNWSDKYQRVIQAGVSFQAFVDYEVRLKGASYE
jgi:hypothetical protein